MEPLHQPSISSAAIVTGSAWRGFARGLTPLLTLAGWVAATLLLTLAIREMPTGLDLDTQQWIAVGVLANGLVVATIAYGITLARTFRQWRAHLLKEGDATATGMLWALVVTAAVVVLPIVVAALAPQHPAP
ncbi:MAG TPA: hypothetical protein VFU63_00985 [Ktedonobacterales bacterium]|nr:hypothetical protein [Ktedonobacterales bacterium]